VARPQLFRFLIPKSSGGGLEQALCPAPSAGSGALALKPPSAATCPVAAPRPSAQPALGRPACLRFRPDTAGTRCPAPLAGCLAFLPVLVRPGLGLRGPLTPTWVAVSCNAQLTGSSVTDVKVCVSDIVTAQKVRGIIDPEGRDCSNEE